MGSIVNSQKANFEVVGGILSDEAGISTVVDSVEEVREEKLWQSFEFLYEEDGSVSGVLFTYLDGTKEFVKDE